MLSEADQGSTMSPMVLLLQRVELSDPTAGKMRQRQDPVGRCLVYNKRSLHEPDTLGTSRDLQDNSAKKISSRQPCVLTLPLQHRLVPRASSTRHTNGSSLELGEARYPHHIQIPLLGPAGGALPSQPVFTTSKRGIPRTNTCGGHHHGTQSPLNVRPSRVMPLITAHTIATQHAEKIRKSSAQGPIGGRRRATAKN